MTVRAKPWSYQSNGNTSSCDGSNSSVSGWSGGDTDDFLQQLVDECGDLCIGGGCTTAAGDLNEDEISDLLTFLKTLTDPCVQDSVCLAPWIDGDFKFTITSNIEQGVNYD